MFRLPLRATVAVASQRRVWFQGGQAGVLSLNIFGYIPLFMTVPSPDLAFIARQQDQLLGEVRSMRDDMTVMMEVLRRVEGTTSSVARQITDMHVFNRRVEERVRELEDARA